MTSEANEEDEENKRHLKNRALEQLPVIEINQYLKDTNNKIFHFLLVWHNMNDINKKIIMNFNLVNQSICPRKNNK